MLRFLPDIRRQDSACDRMELPNAPWLTFRRTYSSWSHDQGVPGKVVAQLMGHAQRRHVDVYTQVLDASVRDAVKRIGGEWFIIVQRPEGVAAVTD
jgi:integrase